MKMWLFKISECHLLLLQLSIIISFTRTNGVEVTEVTLENTSLEQTTLDNQSSIYQVKTTTTVPTLKLINESNRKLTSPIAVETILRNSSSHIFRPSIHLGNIEQTGMKMNPFNNVQHVKFENNVQLNTQHERFQDISQDTYQSVFNVLDEATRSSRIKFQDDSVIETPTTNNHSFNDQLTVTQSTIPQLEEPTVKSFFDQAYFQTIEKPHHPMQQETPTGMQQMIFEKPVTDHELTANYLDISRPPYVIDYYNGNNQNSYQPILTQESTFETMKKPDGSVLVVQQQESTYKRKRKYPYQFYQPTGDGYHHVEFEKPGHSIGLYPQKNKNLTSWKRIIHLIGTLLPLGLLLATLTPKVVRITNTTQPNIVLSKLRVVDLPLEHKGARMLDDHLAICEDRTICELILAGGEPQSNILQNILWNFAIRISDDIARKSGLREMFNAVRKRDCMTIRC